MKSAIRAMQKLEEWQVYLQYATTTREVLSQAKADLEVMRATESDEAKKNQDILENQVVPEAEKRWNGIQKVLATNMGCQTVDEAIEKFESAAAAMQLFRQIRQQFFSYRASLDLELELGVTPQKRRELETILEKLKGDMEQQAELVSKLLQLQVILL